MSNTIQIKRSSTAAAVPTAGQLAVGELAVNLVDKKLFTKDALGAVVQLGGGDIASTAEAQAGTDNTKLITPLRMREGFNASGSAPVYACRAWVNFNGTGTVAIRGSGNVSSISDNGTGDYTVNFTTAMPDANYSAVRHAGTALGSFGEESSGQSKTASNFRFEGARTGVGILVDTSENSVSIFR